MTPRKKLSLTRKADCRSEEKRSTNRRTSLNVNLSYVSDPSSSTGDENVGEETVDDFISKRKIDEKLLRTIRSSFVRLTSTPIPSKYADPSVEKKRRDDRSSSQRRRRLSEASTIVIDHSMELTDVQEPHLLPDDHSIDFIPDTECPEFVCGAPIPPNVIPDSQPDASVDTVRASMNVNTSLDSVARPNLAADPKGQSLAEKEADEREINDGVSESSAENLLTNSVLVTRAVIECDYRSSGSDSRRNKDGQTDLEVAAEEGYDARKKWLSLREGISGGEEKRNVNEIEKSLNNNPEREERIEPLDRTPVIRKGIRLDYSSDSSSKNASSSSSSSSSLPPLRGKNLGEAYQRIITSGFNKSRNLAVRSGGKKGKKKLMRLRASEMVDLSPVSVKLTRPAKKLIIRKRVNRRNGTAGKVAKRKSDVAKKLSRVDTSKNEDDGVEEAAQLLPRKEKRVKKFKAKKIVIKKMRDVELQKRMNKNANAVTNDSSDKDDSSDTEFEGNSLDDFEPKYNLTQGKTGLNRPKIIIVVTGLPLEEKKLVKETVAQLGSAKLQKLVSRHTTHVVSKGIRTVNLLRGIIRGCWVVSLEWISRSRQAGNWLDAEAYEMRKFSKVVEKNRRERQLFKAAYVSELFLTCGPIHISRGTSTPLSVLKELVLTAGGRVAPDAEKAKIIIGSGGLKEVWILDSITHGELQPFELYSKKKSSN